MNVAELVRSAPARQMVVVRELNDPAELASVAAQWNALVARCDDQPFYRCEFVALWLRCFAPAGRLRVLTGWDEDGSLVAALPLLETRTRIGGFTLRELGSASNAHSCRFDLLADEPPSAAAAFLDYLEGDPGWDLLCLKDIPERGRARWLLELAQGRGWPVGTWRSQRSPFLALPSEYEALERAQRPGFRKDLRRRRRRLNEHGQVTLERVTTAERLAERLAEGLALEASGWKGRNGTAISQQEDTLAFYTGLAELAAREGALSLFFLRLDGRAIAFDFGLLYGSRYLTLKVAYDERWAAMSPGQLLTDEVFRVCVGEGVQEVDLLGDEAPAKREWTDAARPHDWLYLFRATPAARLAHAVKFVAAPALRRLFR